MIHAVIFDMDGVIVDSTRFHFGIWEEVMKRYGVHLGEEILREINGLDTPAIAENLCERFSLDVHPSVIVSEKKRLAHERMAGGLPLFQGVESTLTILKRLGYRIGLGTSSTRNGVELTLGTRLNGLEFDGIATDSDVERAKPAPDIFLKCAEIMGVPPEECAVVDDSMNGVIAAKSAGMKAVAVATTFPREAFMKMQVLPDIIIEDITQVNPEMIKKLEGE